MVNCPELPSIIRKVCWQLANLLLLFDLSLVPASSQEIIPNVMSGPLN